MAVEWIEQALIYVKEKFENEYSGHDYFHTLRVFKMATRIAECEGAELEIVQLAALLHDVDDRKISPETYESQANARNFLLTNGVDDGKTERIVDLTILDDGAATTLGVTIGDNRDKVVGAHSTPKSETETALIYAAGEGVIAKFLLRDGVVTSITYTVE